MISVARQPVESNSVNGEGGFEQESTFSARLWRLIRTVLGEIVISWKSAFEILAELYCSIDFS